MANVIDDIAYRIIDSTAQLQSDTELYIRSAQFGRLNPKQEYIYDAKSFDSSSLGTIDPTKFDLNVDLRDEFKSEYAKLVSQLQSRIPNEFNTFFNTYFPNTQDNWNDLQEFLADSLANGSIGLPRDIEQQIWDQARERDFFDAKRQEKIAIRSASKRGTSYLQPTINAQIIQAKNDAIRNQSGTNRTIAIESAKLKIEFMKFTISTIVDCQKLAIDACMNYLQQILASYTLANNKARDHVGAYSQLYSALNTYYDAVSKINGIKFQAFAEEERNQLEYYKTNLDHTMKQDDRFSRVALGAAQILGSEASSAFSGLNVLAGYGNITTN